MRSTRWLILSMLMVGCGGADKPAPPPSQDALEKEAAKQRNIHELEMKTRGSK